LTDEVRFAAEDALEEEDTVIDNLFARFTFFDAIYHSGRSSISIPFNALQKMACSLFL
jgi:hypothetical protein